MTIRYENERLKQERKGTREWSDFSFNCATGCRNGCLYCYARTNRYRRKSLAAWKKMVVNPKAAAKALPTEDGVIMFPTSHDIIEKDAIKRECFALLQRFFDAKKKVLITTKPRPSIIKEIIETFAQYKHLIEFRFTVTSLDNKTLKYWEPGAPCFKKRMKALKEAFDNGFRTSVAIEPFLDDDPTDLVKQVLPYISPIHEDPSKSGSVWIGCMSPVPGLNKRHRRSYEEIRKNYEQDNLERVCRNLLDLDDERIKFKDSFVNELIGASKARMCRDVPVAFISTDEAKRTVMEPTSLDALKKSIEDDDLIHPIVVAKEKGKAALTLVAGRRRLQVYSDLRRARIPAVILTDAVDKKEIIKLQLAENVHRTSLNAINEAHIYLAYLQAHGSGTLAEWQSRMQTYNQDPDRLDENTHKSIENLCTAARASGTTVWRHLTLLELDSAVQKDRSREKNFRRESTPM